MKDGYHLAELAPVLLLRRRMEDNQTGWGVVRILPWHLLGVYKTSAEAQVRCLEAGKGYEVHFGEGNVARNQFTWLDSSIR
jgi:hypothetical protein